MAAPLAASASTSAALAEGPGLPALPSETVTPGVSTSTPSELGTTGRGNIMARVPGKGRVKTFYIDRTEVSVFAHWRCRAEECYGKGYGDSEGTLPKRGVLEGAQLTLTEARQHCRAEGKRLPTYAELELASAGGKKEHSKPPWPSVGEGNANRFGLFGFNNHMVEWSGTAGKQKGYQAAWGVPVGEPEVPIEDNKMWFRCAADAKSVKPLPKSEKAVLLSGGWGACARLESTRETFCWGGLPSYLGGEEPGDISRQPKRITALDNARELDTECALFEKSLVCQPFDAPFHAVAVEPGSTFFSARGGIFTLSSRGLLVEAIDTGEGYGTFHQTVRYAFPAKGGFLVQQTKGDWTWGGVDLSENGGMVDFPVKLTLPGTVRAVLELDEETCLRFDTGGDWSCGRLRKGGFDKTHVIPGTVVETAQHNDAWCVFTTRGSVHCGKGTLTSARLKQPLPPPTLTNMVDFGGGIGMVCAVDRKGSVHCWKRSVQHSIFTTGSVGGTPLEFERVAIPAPK